MSGKDGGRPIELLGQHGPGHEMRPGGLAESEQQVRLLTLGRRVAVGRADQEARLANPAIAPLFELAREFFGRQLPAAFVEQDGAEGCLRIGRLASAFGKLGKLYRPADAFLVAGNQFRLGRTGNLSAGYDVQEQLTPCPRPEPLRPRPTCAPDCKSCALRDGTGARPRRRHRSAPSRQPGGPRSAD